MNDDEESEASFYRRRLPHIRHTRASYFVTWRIAAGTRDLAEPERDIVVDTIRHFDGERFDLDAFVVMNDHVHVLFAPINDQPLEKILHTWKSFSAHRLQREAGRRGAVWQDESFDRVMRNDDEHLVRWRYIVRNPKARWPDLAEYRWLWSRV